MPLTSLWHVACEELAARTPLDLAARHDPQTRAAFAAAYNQLASLARPARRHTLRRLGVSLAGAALLLALGRVPAALAATITVNGDGTGGTCALADAITAANTDAPSGNCPAGSGTDTIDLQTNVGLTTALPEVTTAVRLEGNSHTIGRISGNLSILRLSSSGYLVVRHVTLSGGSTSTMGGGIDNEGGRLTVQYSTITGSTAYAAGGIYVKARGSAIIQHSAIIGNQGLFAGGIHSVGTLTVENSTIAGNSADYYGGGLMNDGTLTVLNSTISGNFSSTDGGGIWSSRSTVLLDHATITGNSSPLSGGLYGGASVTVRNSIIALQTAGVDCSGAQVTQGYNIDSDSSCGFSGTGDRQGATALQLVLGSLGANGGPTQTIPLGSSSVAIDQIPKGTNGCVGGVSIDQRRAVRAGQVVVGDHRGGLACDVGAFEYDALQGPTAVTLAQLQGHSLAWWQRIAGWLGLR